MKRQRILAFSAIITALSSLCLAFLFAPEPERQPREPDRIPESLCGALTEFCDATTAEGRIHQVQHTAAAQGPQSVHKVDHFDWGRPRRKARPADAVQEPRHFVIQLDDDSMRLVVEPLPRNRSRYRVRHLHADGIDGIVRVTQAAEEAGGITALIAEVQDDLPVVLYANPEVDCSIPSNVSDVPQRNTPIDIRLREAAAKQSERTKESLKVATKELTQPSAKHSTDSVDSQELQQPIPIVDLLPEATGEPTDDTPTGSNETPEDGVSQAPDPGTTKAEQTQPAQLEPAMTSGDAQAPTEVGSFMEQQVDQLAEVQPFQDPWHVEIESLTEAQKSRRARIRNVLGFYYNRQLNAVQDSPWSMMHHMIAWGSDSLIWTGTPGQSKRVNCIGWLCANGVCEGERLLHLKNGKIYPRVGPGLQGHEGQFLAMLAQARVSAKQPIRVGGQMFTVQDLIKQEQLACRPKTELTFRLIGLVHYLDTDTSWKSSDGQEWDFPRLIREEIAQPVNGVTCGGTHRLMGMSYAVRRRLQEGRPVDGQWDRADRYTADYRNYAYAMRNRDGSCSSDFWRSRGSWGDIDRKLKTTGHILEWMVFSSPHDELENPKLAQSIDFLTMLLAQNRYYDWGKGALGHAIRALSLYDERVFGGTPGERDLKLASRPPRIVPKEKQADQQQATKKGSLRRALLFRRPTR